LQWNLKYGHKLKWMQRLRASGEYVKALDTQIVLYQDLTLIYRAFTILNSSRNAGFSAGPIPLTEILAYMTMFNIDRYKEKQLFLQRIQILDTAYLEYHREV